MPGGTCNQILRFHHFFFLLESINVGLILHHQKRKMSTQTDGVFGSLSEKRK